MAADGDAEIMGDMALAQIAMRNGDKLETFTPVGVRASAGGVVIIPTGEGIIPIGEALATDAAVTFPIGKTPGTNASTVFPIGEIVFAIGGALEASVSVIFPIGKMAETHASMVFPIGETIVPIGTMGETVASGMASGGAAVLLPGFAARWPRGELPLPGYRPESPRGLGSCMLSPRNPVALLAP